MSDQQNVTPKRIFKTGSTLIDIDATMAHRSNDAICDLLKLQYPELAHATLREIPQEPLADGTPVMLIEAMPSIGSKG